MKKMRVFVVGCNGYIGKQLTNVISRSHEYFGISRNAVENNLYLDLEQPNNFNFDCLDEGDIIVFLAAISSPDICKDKYEYAYKVNVVGTKYFIENCIDKGCKVLFFSSDTVYGDADIKFNENCKGNPIGEYAEMKKEIEDYFFASKLFKVFRLSYVFSKNDKFIRYLNECVNLNKTAEIFHPFCRNIVYVGDLIQAIVNLIQTWDRWENKIFNIVGSELVSRLNLTYLFRKYVNSDLEYKTITPHDDFFKARPKKIEVESLYFKKLLGREITSIEDAFLKEFK